MNYHYLKILGVITLSLGVFGCGDGGVPLASNGAPTVLGRLNTVLNATPQSATAPTLPVGGGVTTSSTDLTPSSLASCQTVTPGTLVDADSDNIAKEKKYTFNCTNVADGTTTVTRKGTMEIYDLDDTVAGTQGGLKYVFDITNFDTINSDGSENRYSYKGTYLYKWDGSSFVFTSEFSGGYYSKSASSSSSNYELDYTYDHNFDYRVTPNSISSPWTAGSIEFTGTYRFDGKFFDEASRQTVEARYVVEIYSQSLKYDSTCTKFYQSGSIFIDDLNGNIYEYRYSCTSAKVYKNGVEFTDITL